MVSALSAGPTLSVPTTLGPVKGFINDAGVRVWKGLRYAQAPIGSLRWEYPRVPAYSNQEFIATSDAAGCPQSCSPPQCK